MPAQRWHSISIFVLLLTKKKKKFIILIIITAVIMSPWLGNNSGSENAFFLKMIFIFIVLAAFFGKTLKMSANAQDG